MATWREIIESKDYQDLPLGEKVKTKNEFLGIQYPKATNLYLYPKMSRQGLRRNFLLLKTMKTLILIVEINPLLVI